MSTYYLKTSKNPRTKPTQYPKAQKSQLWHTRRTPSTHFCLKKNNRHHIGIDEWIWVLTFVIWTFWKMTFFPPDPLSLRRSLRSLAIAVLPLSRIRGDRQRAAIIIVKEVAPQNQRRLLTRQHCSLVTVGEEVSAQSCHHSLTAVKNSRRTKDVGGVGNNQFNRQIFSTNRRGSQTRN